jgi:hypothetical protein
MTMATTEDWILTYSGWLALIQMLANQSLLKYNLFHYTNKIIFYTYIFILTNEKLTRKQSLMYVQTDFMII